MSDMEGVGQIEIDVNRAPRLGQLSVHPNQGISLVDVFHITATGWIDEDLPLSYVFSYRISSESSQSVQNAREVLLSDLLLSNVVQVAI